MVLQLCLSQSTAHGLGNIANEPHISGKVIWSILTVVTSVFFFCHSYLLYGQLLEENVLVAIHNYAVDFIQPDIVFCPERFFAKDYINDPPPLEYEYMLNVSRHIQDFDKLYKQSGLNLTTYIWDSLNWHQLYKAFFHRKEELFLRLTCNLKELDLSESTLSEEMNIRYFACYRFNSSMCKLKTPFDNLVVTFYTHNYGTNITYSKLKVLINNRTVDSYSLDQKDSVDEIENGMHIFFLRPNQGIYSGALQVTAPIGTHTSIAIKSTHLVQVPTKQFRCRSKKKYFLAYNLLEKDILTNPLNLSSNAMCIQSLLQWNIYHRLNCVSTKFPIMMRIPSNFTFCGDLFKRFNRPFDFSFIWKEEGMFDKIVKICKERWSCDTVIHNVNTNYNNWPRTSTLRGMLTYDIPRRLDYVKKNNLTNPGLLDALVDFERNPSSVNNWKQNFIKVTITPGEYKSTVVEESLSYSLKNFFSDVGGILGFYMGGSLLTIFEIFRLIQYVVHGKIRHQKKELDVEAQSLHDVTDT